MLPMTARPANPAAEQNQPIGAATANREADPKDIPNGGSGSPRSLRSLIPGISIRFVPCVLMIGPPLNRDGSA
jgi:hypothetical protein